ncbi:MAG: hypothetical protein ACP5RF_03330 [Candidatus Micrarchaeia archaeon]
MKGWRALFFLIVALIVIPATNFAQNLTSCVGCSQVTCPAGAVCHNIGSCSNGYVKWGCQYANGSIVNSNSSISTTIPTTTATTIPSTNITNTTTLNATTIATTVAAIPTTIIPSTNSLPISWIGYIAVIVIIIVVLLIYYALVSKKKGPTA